MSIAHDYLDYARKLSKDVDRKFKHVSLVVVKNRVVGVGTNVRKTHPQAKKIGYLFEERHSELDAFIKVPKYCRSQSMKLINYRFNKQGVLRCSKPCKKCILWVPALFDEVWYSVDDGIELLTQQKEIR